MTASEPVPILLVEDNDGDAGLVRHALRRNRHNHFLLDRVTSMGEARRHLAEKSPTLILLDLSLPDSSGINTVIEMRQVAGQIPIIVLTGHDDQEFALTTLENGAQDYLVKGEIAGDTLTRAMRYAISRGRLEQRLLQSEERMSLVLRGSNDGWWDWDLENGDFYGSPRWWQILGLPASESPTSVNYWLALIHQEDIERVSATISSAIDAGDDEFNFEFRARHADGHYVPLKARGFILRNRNRRALRISGSNIDLTERKRHETQLLESKQAAEAANRAKSNFLATMSHEIRTPMNAILGMADLLMESPLNHEQRHYVEVFRNAGEALLDLINDILDLSRVESGMLQLEELPFTINSILNSISDLFGGRAEEKGLELRTGIDPETPGVVIGDPTRLRQILFNLVGNALKFTLEGTITVTVTPIVDSHKLAPNGGEDSEHNDRIMLQFSVLDTGIGIAADQQQEIFDAFTQADSTITRRFGGTGLGLSICQQLVDRIGGKIWVESEPGIGSGFHFTLPFTISQSPNLPPDPRLEGLEIVLFSPQPERRQRITALFNSIWLQPKVVEPGSKCNLHPLLQHQINNRTLIVLDQEQVDSSDLISDWLDQCISQINDSPSPLLLLGPASHRRPIGHPAHHYHGPLDGESLRIAVIKAIELSTAIPTKNRANKRLRLLLAEDSDDNALLISAYLKGMPIEIDRVEDGEQAVEQCCNFRYDVVLMDVQMPNMDGLAATRLLRKMERESGSPPRCIIALTANASSDDEAASLAAGCNAHISKPVRKTILIDRIEQTCLASGQKG